MNRIVVVVVGNEALCRWKGWIIVVIRTTYVKDFGINVDTVFPRFVFVRTLVAQIYWHFWLSINYFTVHNNKIKGDGGMECR